MCNEDDQAIEFATIQLWWDGADVSNDIVNLGNGLYYVSLEPITVGPKEDPILLNMVISAEGCQNKFFETYLAVDPDNLDKELGNSPGESPLTIIIITSTSIAGGIGVVGIILLLRRKWK